MEVKINIVEERDVVVVVVNCSKIKRQANTAKQPNKHYKIYIDKL